MDVLTLGFIDLVLVKYDKRFEFVCCTRDVFIAEVGGLLFSLFLSFS